MHPLTKLIHDDMIPALGVTEPGAIAFAAARARSLTKGPIQSVAVAMNSGLYKNAFTCGIPNSHAIGNVFSAALGVVLGVPLGLLAGYKGGAWEYWIMRACDTFQSFPSIILVLAMVSLLGPSVWNIIWVIGGLGWASVARLVYSGTLSTKQTGYVEASRALGATDRAILFRTLLPNVIAPVWAALPLKVVRAILSESSLSCLGVGLRTPQASWGNLTQNAMELVTLTTRPWAWIPPGLCIVLTVLCLQFVGDGLRDAMDPRHRFISH